MKIIHRTLVATVALLSTAQIQSANWPAWRGGPEGTGVTAEKSLPVEWSDTKNVRWKVPLPDRGNSTPIIWGNRVYVTQAIEKEDRRTLMCFNRVDGTLIWQSGVTFAEKERTHEDNPYCAASPVTDGERVIASFGSAGLYCYDLSGKEQWHRDFGKQDHEWGNASSPVLYGDLCFFYHGPGPGAHLVALDKKSGKTVWKFDEPLPQTAGRTDGFRGREPGYVGTWSTPIVVKSAGRDELVMSFPNRVVAFEPKTGKHLWACDGLNPLVYTSPIYGEGLVVAMGGFFGSTVSVKPGGNGNVTDSARTWREERAKKNRCGSGVIAGGHLYVANMEGFLECVDLKTGNQLWEERLKGAGPKSESWSSTLLAGDRIYAVNRSGDVMVFKASPKFEVISVNAVGNELTNASLAPSDGDLFLRTYNHLWCIGETKRSAAAK